MIWGLGVLLKIFQILLPVFIGVEWKGKKRRWILIGGIAFLIVTVAIQMLTGYANYSTFISNYHGTNIYREYIVDECLSDEQSLNKMASMKIVLSSSVILFVAERFSEARQGFTRILFDLPTIADTNQSSYRRIMSAVTNNLGVTLLMLDESYQARVRFEEALHWNEADQRAHENLGILLFKEKTGFGKVGTYLQFHFY